MIIESIDVLIPVLARRKWSIYYTDFSTKYLGGFACSDNPVSLVYQTKRHPFFSPGFGMPGTEVTMPLSKDVVIVGRFEGKETVTEIPIKGMALINSRTGAFTDRFLYHPIENFIFLNKQNDISNVNYLLTERDDYNEKEKAKSGRGAAPELPLGLK